MGATWVHDWWGNVLKLINENDNEVFNSDYIAICTCVM